MYFRHGFVSPLDVIRAKPSLQELNFFVKFFDKFDTFATFYLGEFFLIVGVFRPQGQSVVNYPASGEFDS